MFSSDNLFYRSSLMSCSFLPYSQGQLCLPLQYLTLSSPFSIIYFAFCSRVTKGLWMVVITLRKQHGKVYLWCCSWWVSLPWFFSLPDSCFKWQGAVIPIISDVQAKISRKAFEAQMKWSYKIVFYVFQIFRTITPKIPIGYVHWSIWEL